MTSDDSTTASHASAFDAWRGQSLDELTARFTQAGCFEDPQGWAGSEIRENYAQFARFAFLRSMWEYLLETQEQCVTRTVASIDSEVSDAEQERLARVFADQLGGLAHSLLYHIDHGTHDQLAQDEPGWILMEAFNAGDDLSGRNLGSLHESLWECHPDGQQACEEGGWV